MVNVSRGTMFCDERGMRSVSWEGAGEQVWCGWYVVEGKVLSARCGGRIVLCVGGRR
jgi:hypothetical protein